MRVFLQRLYHWPLNHTVQFALSLFILGCIASIFSQDIRAFLSLPPQKLNIWILKSRLIAAKKNLVALQHCHGNAYQLLRFLAPFFASGMIFFIFATIMVFLFPMMPQKSQNTPLLLIVCCAFLASLLDFLSVTSFMKQLWRFTKETRKLERRVTLLADRLAAKGIDTLALLKQVEDIWEVVQQTR